MSILQTVTEILREHVTLEVESVDRMYLNLYVPKLQYAGGIASFSAITVVRSLPRRR